MNMPLISNIKHVYTSKKKTHNLILWVSMSIALQLLHSKVLDFFSQYLYIKYIDTLTQRFQNRYPVTSRVFLFPEE